MGFTLNGNTAIVAICVLAALLIASITVIVATGQVLPGVLSDALIALVSAVAGGSVVHQAASTDRKEYKETVQNVVKDAVHEEVANH